MVSASGIGAAGPLLVPLVARPLTSTVGDVSHLLSAIFRPLAWMIVVSVTAGIAPSATHGRGVPALCGELAGPASGQVRLSHGPVGPSNWVLNGALG